jgi:hypothetical protein
MVGLVVFNIMMLLLCGAVGSRVVPEYVVGGVLDWLHNAIGITLPPADKQRMVAIIWLGSTMVIVDAVLFMLVFFTTLVM